MSGRWQALNLLAASIPTLYVKGDFKESGYTIRITDLVTLWSEQLSETEICHRAATSKCSIDPLEDHTQLGILIDKIRAGLDLPVEIRAKETDLLSVSVTAPLPAPLSPFVWPLCLAKQDARAFAREVTCGLLESLRVRQSNVTHLQSLVRDKDHVISRLLDRTESAGMDLTTIFPGTSGLKLSKKTPRRIQLEQHVKGLRQYDPAVPKANDDTEPNDTKDDFLDVVNSIMSHSQLEMPLEWPSSWTNDNDGAPSEVPAATGSDADTVDEDFDPAATFQTSHPAAPLSSERQSDPGADRSRSMPVGTDSSPEALTSTKAKSIKHFGRIGGQKNATREDRSKSPASAASSIAGSSPAGPCRDRTVTSSPQTPSRIGKLGVIGGRKHGPSSTTDADATRSQKSSDQAEATQAIPLENKDRISKSPLPVRETSVERANSRREQLKHQLAVQPASTVTRKRRRF